MGVDEFFRLRARLVDLARSVDAYPANIGVPSTGEACAVALLLDRLDLLDRYKHSLSPSYAAIRGQSPAIESRSDRLSANGWK